MDDWQLRRITCLAQTKRIRLPQISGLLMGVWLLTACASSIPIQHKAEVSSPPPTHFRIALAVDDRQEPPTELLRIKQERYLAAIKQMQTGAGARLVSENNAANEDMLGESKLAQENAVAVTTGVPVAYSKIERHETVWMVELMQIEGRQQIAQQWRILREQFPEAMAERFVVARAVDKKRKMYALYVGNFADIELGEAWCEVVRTLYPACQVLPSDAIGGGSTSLRMSVQLSAPEMADGAKATPHQTIVAPTGP